MAQQLTTTVENNFTKGLITQSTGLNFPENAATSCDNVEFTLIGDTLRRQGINFEVNHSDNIVSRSGVPINTYKWNNVGGDGNTQIVVEQIGATLYFYRSSTATVNSPLSAQLLGSTVTISSFLASGGTFDVTTECQFSDGNGYLFVYHPSCDPFYCTYVAGVITGNIIDVQQRDFAGVFEVGVPDINRPAALTAAHLYNLLNQGWRNDTGWQANSTTAVPYATLVFVGNVASTFTVSAGLPIIAGTPVLLQATIFFTGGSGSQFLPHVTGVVTSYAGTNLIINTNTIGYTGPNTITSEQWAITPLDIGGQLGTWNSQVGGYPSNADVWWSFKDSTGTFNPISTIGNVTLSTPAPKGSFILDAFNQNRNALSAGVTNITTTVRPRTGTWFQGRTWFAGVDSNFSSGSISYSWTESIFFSQTITDPSQFGKCYQVNDPTSETLFALLPTDGGVIKIQGCGSVYRLFPIQNGLLVFAANGIWFITGSQGIGFSANDYTITKISSVQSIASTSFVDVQGLPYFWNEEGIYQVTPSKNGSLEVNPITVSTILSFYNEIPLSSKKYARGTYHPIDYNIQWIYKDTEANDVTDRYSFNKILNYNTYNQAFFPFTVDISSSVITGIQYVAGPGGSTAPLPSIKYSVSTPFAASYKNTFGEEYDTTYVDWGNINYTSFFITGYKLRGQAIKKFQPQYVQMYARTNGAASSYKIQSLWDFSNSGNSGKWSTLQQVNHNLTHFDTVHKRIKIRGNGYALQIKVTSTDGVPFDIQGWAIVDTVNQGT